MDRATIPSHKFIHNNFPELRCRNEEGIVSITPDLVTEKLEFRLVL